MRDKVFIQAIKKIIKASRLTITPLMWFGPSRLYGNKEFDLMKITKTLHWSCGLSEWVRSPV
jgi:hypothetical protein